MWLSPKIFSILEVAKEAVQDLREELAAVKAERDVLSKQLIVAQTNMDWMRIKVNSLEAERPGLIEKAFDIKLPSVPEILRTPRTQPDFNPAPFADIGEDLAKVLGMPTYDDPR